MGESLEEVVPFAAGFRAVAADGAGSRTLRGATALGRFTASLGAALEGVLRL